jgi:tape measure domain-containing protein
MPSPRSLRAGRAIIELALVGSKTVKKQLDAMQKQATKVSRSFMSIGSFGSIGSGGFSGIASLRNLFVGSAAAGALLWPVKMAANLEHSAATMSVFTESAESARAMLDELNVFSEISMLPFDELATGAKLLMRVGNVAEKDVVPAIKSLATLSGGSVEEFQAMSLAFAQVGSAGRLQGEEMRQFKNTAFNPIREIAERTGESMDDVKKRMEAGGIPFEDVMASLLMATGEGGRFAGLLETISNTLKGQFMKAWAGFKRVVLPLGEELLSPLTDLFRSINGAMPMLAAFINQNKGWIKWAAVGALAIAGLAVGFVTLGLGVSLVGIAAGGVASLLGAIGGVLGMILSPLGATAVGAVLLTKRFWGLGNVVSSVVGWMGASFSDL